MSAGGNSKPDELRRARNFLEKVRQLFDEVHGYIFYNGPSAARIGYITDGLVREAGFVGMGFGIHGWDNTKDYWCFNPEYKMKQEEILRLASQLMHELNKKTRNGINHIDNAYVTDVTGEHIYQDPVRSIMQSFRENYLEFQNLVYNS
ncbi:hypothetical protein [Halomonas koreensis]|uniref:Uncharacterized protein n=1 Tax=Halomonas koreensis TaxID=245385 RepID=A0ABU1G583_9GAMM|nr:hypothetical protein [Halomonas koreensis]MDR5868106.1 hypothetical protein [Halomonas koreensis]